MLWRTSVDGSGGRSLAGSAPRAAANGVHAGAASAGCQCAWLGAARGATTWTAAAAVMASLAALGSLWSSRRPPVAARSSTSSSKGAPHWWPQQAAARHERGATTQAAPATAAVHLQQGSASPELPCGVLQQQGAVMACCLLLYMVR
jgi:hypothetical protein